MDWQEWLQSLQVIRDLYLRIWLRIKSSITFCLIWCYTPLSLIWSIFNLSSYPKSIFIEQLNTEIVNFKNSLKEAPWPIWFQGFDWGFDYDYNPLRNCDLIEELIVQVHDLMDQNLRIWFGIFPNSGCDIPYSPRPTSALRRRCRRQLGDISLSIHDSHDHSAEKLVVGSACVWLSPSLSLCLPLSSKRTEILKHASYLWSIILSRSLEAKAFLKRGESP